MARVGETSIGAGDLLAELRRAGGTPRQALTRLIDFELLAAAAAASIGASDADVVAARARAAVERTIERDLEPRLKKSSIPRSELRAVYERARRAFVHPRLVEVALLSVYTGARMRDEPRARSHATAIELEAEVRRRPNHTPEDFEALAADPAWRGRQVKYARLWQAFDEPFPAEVGRAVAALAHPGDTSGLITSEAGYHIARYIGERPPENVTFEEAEPRLRDQVFERWRQAQFLEFVQRLANPHQIEAFPERMEPLAAPP